MHFFDVVQINERRVFLTEDTICLFWVGEDREKVHTSRAASVSSTSATSHQLSRLHNEPSSPGRTTKYDLKSAVSTTCAHRTSCSGVREEKEVSGIPRSESLDVSDRKAWR